MRRGTEHNRRRGKYCPECTGVQEKAIDVEGRPVWVCRCCGAEEPRQIRRSRKKRQLDETLKQLLRGDESKS